MFVLIDLLGTESGQINVPHFYAAEMEKLVLSRDLWNFPRRGEARQTFHEARRGEAREGRGEAKRFSECHLGKISSIFFIDFSIFLSCKKKNIL